MLAVCDSGASGLAVDMLLIVFVVAGVQVFVAAQCKRTPLFLFFPSFAWRRSVERDGAALAPGSVLQWPTGLQ